MSKRKTELILTRHVTIKPVKFIGISPAQIGKLRTSLSMSTIVIGKTLRNLRKSAEVYYAKRMKKTDLA